MCPLALYQYPAEPSIFRTPVFAYPCLCPNNTPLHKYRPAFPKALTRPLPIDRTQYADKSALGRGGSPAESGKCSLACYRPKQVTVAR